MRRLLFTIVSRALRRTGMRMTPERHGMAANNHAGPAVEFILAWRLLS